MKAFIVAFLSLFVAFVAAQSSSTPFYITSPIGTTTYKAGSTITLTWTNGINEAATVDLITGTVSSAMKPTGNTFSINGASGKQTWKVPTDLPQNATFAFMITYLDAKKATQTSFSTPFAITGTTGSVVTQSFVTAASTSAAVASSASASSSIVIVTPSVVPTTSIASKNSSASASMIATSTPSAPTSGAVETKSSLMAAAGAIVVISSVLFF